MLLLVNRRIPSPRDASFACRNWTAVGFGIVVLIIVLYRYPLENAKERAINNWRLSLPSLEISPGYSRCAGPGEKYQQDSC